MTTLSSALILLGQLFNSISGGTDLIDQNYYLKYSTGLALKNTLSEVSYCQDQKNWKTVSSQKIIRDIDQVLTRALSVAYKNSQDSNLANQYFDLQNKKDQTLEGLKQALAASEIQGCRFTDKPDYSDGHTYQFVSINQEMSFVYEVGYPD